MKKLLTILSISAAFASYAMAADGATLYNSCKACHGAQGQMKAMGKSKPLNTLTSDQIATDLKGYKAGKLNRYGFGAAMKPHAAKLSDADIDALAKYIPTLKK